MSTDPRGPASDAPAPPRELWQIVCAKHGMECASTGPFRSTLEARDNLPYCGFIGHGGLRIEPLAASPAQEATPPRVAEYERQLRDAAEEHEDVNASFALEAFLALKRAAPTPEASAPEPEDWQSRADRLVGGDLRRLLPGEIVAAYERCREYIVMPRQGTEYGLFSAKADLWRVVTYAATVAALTAERTLLNSENIALHKALQERERDTNRLDWFGTPNGDADVVISSPGNHGGDVANWLLTLESQRGRSREWEAPTLREAIDLAARAAPRGDAAP